jgi:hypothetical protein
LPGIEIETFGTFSKEPKLNQVIPAVQIMAKTKNLRSNQCGIIITR